MPKTTIPAAGEAMPRNTRRNFLFTSGQFLAGSAVALALASPTLASADPVAETSMTVSELINRLDSLSEEQKQAIVDQFSESQEEKCLRLTRELIAEMGKLPSVRQGDAAVRDIHMPSGVSIRLTRIASPDGTFTDALFYRAEGGAA
jgi:DNA-directed RNA polymerase subunit H (RpoH/RPB5)